jgi:hypothetical protein
MSRLARLILCAALLALTAGCGGSDKGKNKDKDVPKAPEAPAAK